MQALKNLLPMRVIEGLRYIRHGRLTWDRSLPSSVPAAAMTTGEEQALFTRSVRDVAKLSGEIIDLGCWMGSTTLSLAAGLRDLNDKGQVHAFDRFLWEPWMDRYSSEHWCDYQPGESFLPEARRRMGGLKPWVNLVQADLLTYRWEGGPVRLLLVDAMKSWRLTTAIARGFYQSLVKGALVLHQDYLTFNHPWLPILQHRLRDHMSYVACVSHGGTAAFNVLKEIPADVLLGATDFSGLTDDETELALKWSLQQVGELARASTACARIMYHLGKNDVARSKALLADSEKDIDLRNFAAVKKDIETAESGDLSWSALYGGRISA